MAAVRTIATSCARVLASMRRFAGRHRYGWAPQVGALAHHPCHRRARRPSPHGYRRLRASFGQLRRHQMDGHLQLIATADVLASLCLLHLGGVRRCHSIQPVAAPCILAWPNHAPPRSSTILIPASRCCLRGTHHTPSHCQHLGPRGRAVSSSLPSCRAVPCRVVWQVPVGVRAVGV